MRGNKLIQLENNIAELENLGKSYSLDVFKADTSKQWALRYGFFESIQIIIDISCHIVVHQNLGVANTYADCIILLRKFNYIDADLEKSLKGMVGLRNLLIHEYIIVDIEKLYGMLLHLDDFKRFIEAINPYIEKNP
jgi:uncharacterized protein YutE (UPF0331/DUF86 family)